MTELSETARADRKIRLIVICGPTGVGKSAAAMALVREFGGEVVSADSMQVYRFMDIGTAKPSAEDRALVRHRLIDVVNPDETFNAALYTVRARSAIEELNRDGKNIWVVGGTGLYIRALLGGLLEGPGTDEALREEYRSIVRRQGTKGLHDRLKEKDEAAADRIHPHDAVRIMRALEVLELSGESITARQSHHRFSETPYECLKIGMTDERDRLYEKIDRRCDGMIEKGLVREVEGLLARGYSASLKPMQSLGYRHMVRFAAGELSLDEAVALTKRDTRYYSKRQLTWFRTDGEILWHRPGDLDRMRKRVDEFLSRNRRSDLS